jgi:hypothetical protein
MARIGRFLSTLAVLVAAWAVWPAFGISLAADDGKRPEPKSIAHPPAQSSLPSERDCRRWAARFETAVNQGDSSSCNELIDWNALLQKATAYPNLDAEQARLRDLFISEAKSTSRSPAGFTGQVLEAAGHGGSYKLLRCRNVDGHRRAFFRMVANDAAVNYHDFVLASSPDGLVRAVDCYIFLAGQMLSDVLRESFLPVARTMTKGGFDQLAAPERDYMTHISEVGAMAQWFREKEYRRVLDGYERLPRSLKKMKSIFIFRLRAAQSLGGQDYLRAIDDFRKEYPTDPSCDFIALDAQFLAKSYDQVLATIDHIDKAVGSDPYLKVYRANILGAQGKFSAAEKMAEGAITEEPTLKPAYFALVDLSLVERDFAKTAKMLSLIESKLGMRFKDLTTVPAYAEFVKSAEYKAWLKSHRGEH